MTTPTEPQGLALRIAEDIRLSVVAGEIRAGQRLSEAKLCTQLEVSRNTLREAFRILVAEGLLIHEPNKGVSVTVPTMATVIDIYRVRRLLECQALRQAYAGHPASSRIHQAVQRAQEAQARQDWPSVGTANMAFHKAIVELADSPRLNLLFERILAELRLAFGLLQSPELLHAPYVSMNQRILALYDAGDMAAAAQELDSYLSHSERVLLAHLGELQTR
ncbi:GntR family transcriptional regulator [Amphibiibacter pelophylacis]|uniref:GntR family transcriptional regulator n=1 Tax=Amphibiibacter pelophylacis TaxID=1799477 RepID=A0ACC6P2J1_9BURK